MIPCGIITMTLERRSRSKNRINYKSFSTSPFKQPIFYMHMVPPNAYSVTYIHLPIYLNK